jgi:uncharacterized protein YjbI with pentapeptide repeats
LKHRGNFNGASLRRANLSGADFLLSKLLRANFPDAGPIVCNLENIDLSSSKLIKAMIYAVNPMGAITESAQINNLQESLK